MDSPAEDLQPSVGAQRPEESVSVASFDMTSGEVEALER